MIGEIGVSFVRFFRSIANMYEREIERIVYFELFVRIEYMGEVF